jgi:hypothetical protein
MVRVLVKEHDKLFSVGIWIEYEKAHSWCVDEKTGMLHLWDDENSVRVASIPYWYRVELETKQCRCSDASYS